MSQSVSEASPEPVPLRHPVSAAALLIGAAITSLVGLAASHLLRSEQAGLVAAASFSAVLSAAMVISWGAEAGQFFIAQGFAVAIVALLQVLPEFMVEAVIAWKGEVGNMFANATGSNRLLIGLGWPLIYFTADISSRIRHGRGAGDVKLRRENVLEMVSLFLGSAFYLKILLVGTLTLFDGFLLCGCYVLYMYTLSRLPEEDAESKEDLLAPARWLAEIRSPAVAKASIFGLFLIGALVMAFVSDPFVESLKTVAVLWGIAPFTFIQWVAPFLSEFPEKVTAVYWSQTVRLAPMALLNMISSTVSQFTLLVGMIPLVYAASVLSGHIHVPDWQRGFFGAPYVPLNTPFLKGEVFLSWAMTLLGCAQIAKLRFTRFNAIVILVIWLLQFVAGLIVNLTGLSETTQHVGMGIACLVLAAIEIAVYWREIDLRAAFRETLELMRTTTEEKHVH